MRCFAKGGFRPEGFDGKKVLILGLGNTGGDIADVLVGHASSISISHNHGAVIVRPPPLQPPSTP